MPRRYCARVSRFERQTIYEGVVNGLGMTSARSRERLILRLRKQKIASDEVLDILNVVPRHEFVDAALAHRAYEDSVLPIGFQQTISQPTIVAMMSTAAAGSLNRERVLEIGTGCGYQTAVLAYLFDEVCTVERIESLQLRAKQILSELRIHNVSYKFGDGYAGWSEKGPFDVIIGTAFANEIPVELKNQVRVGGRIVIPVADRPNGAQSLILATRTPDGFSERHLSGVRFVPMLEGTEASV